MAVIIYAKVHNDWVTEQWVMDNRDFKIFGFRMDILIAQHDPTLPISFCIAQETTSQLYSNGYKIMPFPGNNSDMAQIL